MLTTNLEQMKKAAADKIVEAAAAELGAPTSAFSVSFTDIEKDELRKSIGIVLQDTHLFTGTIADNIRYGHKR